ncbi:hypothetical protein LCGC14_1532570 [marine sediment metagenome]|uniref:PD-(D/E)XK endonuclease-like domain-containing protein n=1 Tax=marine sediment metagenome TaxID=412755 RepID=A0A0F9JGA9_9ZZZZ
MNIPDLNYPVPTHETWKHIDNTRLECYERCERRFFFKYVLGWRSTKPNKDLVWGEAVHRMLGHCDRRGWDEENRIIGVTLAQDYYQEHFDIIDEVDNAPKNRGQLEIVMNHYWNFYRREIESGKYNVLATEIAFRMKLPGGIVATGRLDRIDQDTDTYELIIREYKTAGKRLDDKSINQWQLSGQLAMYTTAILRKYPEHTISGAAVRHIVPYKTDTKTNFTDIPVSLDTESLLSWLQDVQFRVSQIIDDFRILGEPNGWKYCFARRKVNCYDFGRLCPWFDLCAKPLSPMEAYSEGPPRNCEVKFWDPTEEKTEEIWEL